MTHADGLIPSVVDLDKDVCEVDSCHILNNGAHWPALIVEVVIRQCDGLALRACIIPSKAGDLCDQVALQICAPSRARYTISGHCSL